MSEIERSDATLDPLKGRKVGSDDLLEVFLVGGEIYVAAGSKEEALGWAMTQYYDFDDVEELEATAADDHEYYPEWEDIGCDGPSFPMIDQAREKAKTEPVPFIVAHSIEYL